MKANDSPSPKKPILVKRSNVTVKIEAGRNTVGGVSYDRFFVVHYDGARRKNLTLSSLEEAKREAALHATKLANGENEVLRLTSTGRTICVQVVEQLRPLNVPLNVAVLEYTSALKNLPDGTTLKEAVDFFRRRHPASVQKRTVRREPVPGSPERPGVPLEPLRRR